MANANPSVPSLVRQRLALAPGHRLPWNEVMSLALYAPGSGYYRQGIRSIGRSGDFYTSVSVGPLYGTLLAQYCAEIWHRLGEPLEFSLLEQGAHDGTLAHDVLTALQSSHPAVFDATHLFLIEPDRRLQAAQKTRLEAKFPTKFTSVAGWAEATGRTGVILCNELLDAFPVHRIGFTQDEQGGRWQEWHVEEDTAGAFRFALAPISSELLQKETERLGSDFPPGYRTEINLQMLEWLDEIDRSGFNGAVLLADYGHASREYYASERHEGTLRRYYRHQSDDRVLEDLGEADLTAHVNFTRLAEAGEERGFQVGEFIEQGRFLTRLAVQLMQDGGFQPSPSWMRQFQSLTHPSHLGHSFQVLALERGLPSGSEPSLSPRLAALRRLGIHCRLD